MEKQKLIELLRDAYLTGVKEKTFADQMNWLDYDYEAMGGAYAGAVVNNGVLDDVIISGCVVCKEPMKDFDKEDNNCCDKCWLEN
jgi:hypothetical protein